MTGNRTQFIDVSHEIEHGLVTYHGLPAPVICDYLSREASHGVYAPDTEFQIGKIEMVGNTGTYLDSPFHRYPRGRDLSELPLSSLAALDCVVIDARTSNRAIDRSRFTDRDLRAKAVLVRTGWDAKWRTDEYHRGHPFLTEDAAEYLRDAAASLVGIDSFNIDCTDDGRRPVHSALLKNDIPIVEHLRGLAEVPETGGLFYAVPAKIKGFGSFPVRAFVAVTD